MCSPLHVLPDSLQPSVYTPKMKTAYIDCSSGISGDMFLGALIDAGLPFDYLKRTFTDFLEDDYDLSLTRVTKCNISASKLSVIVRNNGFTRARRFKDIEKLIKSSNLKEKIKNRGLKIFRSVFEVEALVHGLPFEKAHLHELGAVDFIIDIIGALTGIDYLGISNIIASPVNVGGGKVKISHGELPVPAPATSELLKGIPLYSSGINMELTTPTGAAIIKGISDRFGDFPRMVLESTGYGAGDRDIESHPNVLRIFIGNSSKSNTSENVTVIEANIDDMSPQIYEYVMERLFDSGAREVYVTPVIMKKGRPGNLLTVIADKENLESLFHIIFHETTTIGLRYYDAARSVLDRQISPLETKHGKIGIKIARKDGHILNFTPEYEDCKRIAKERSIPLKMVTTEAIREFGTQQSCEKTMENNE